MRYFKILLTIWVATLLLSGCDTPAEEFAELVASSACVGDEDARICKQGERAGTLVGQTMLHCCENNVFKARQPCQLAASETTTLGGEISSYLGLKNNTKITVNVEVLKYLAFHKFNPDCCPSCKKGGCKDRLIGASWSITGSVDIDKNLEAKSDAIQNILKSLNFALDSLSVAYGQSTQIKSTGELLSLCAERTHPDCSKAKDYIPDDMVPAYTMVFNPKDDENPCVYTAYSHGRTTNHLGFLSIENPIDVPVTVNFSDAFIPPTQYQGYVITLPPRVTISPQSTQVVQVYGFCATNNLPPVPEGVALPPVESWVFIDEVTDIATTGIPADAPGVQPISQPTNPRNRTPITIPGSSTPIEVTIDPYTNPELFASVLIPTMHQLETAVDNLYETGAISTPFSHDPAEERSAIIQHDIWRATATLTGRDYKVEDFEHNLIKQHEANTGQPFATAPVATKEELTEGATVLWNTFSLVGNEAKVFDQATTFCLCYKKNQCATGQLLGRAESGADCKDMGGKSIKFTDSQACERVKK